MKFKIFIYLALLFIASKSCLAQEFEKNGLPCVGEICLGDNISELSKVQWDHAKGPFSNSKKPLYIKSMKVSETEMEMLKTRFKGNLSQSSPFLDHASFDSDALKVLPQVTAACSPNQLNGTYTTSSGNPTRVGISLIPNQSDTTKQQWTVTSISRTFPAAVSYEQEEKITQQLNYRYYKFGAGNEGIQNPEPGEGRFSKNHFGGFGFNLTLFQDIGSGNRMKLHPSCGGNRDVEID